MCLGPIRTPAYVPGMEFMVWFFVSIAVIIAAIMIMYHRRGGGTGSTSIGDARIRAESDASMEAPL